MTKTVTGPEAQRLWPLTKPPRGWQVLGRMEKPGYSLWWALVSPRGVEWTYVPDTNTWAVRKAQRDGTEHIPAYKFLCPPWELDRDAYAAATTVEELSALGVHPEDWKVKDIKQEARKKEETPRIQREAALLDRAWAAIQAGAEIQITDGGTAGWLVKVPSVGWEKYYSQWASIPEAVRRYYRVQQANLGFTVPTIDSLIGAGPQDTRDENDPAGAWRRRWSDQD